MPRTDPRGPKRRFHVWLYDRDIERLREIYAGKVSVNEIVRTLVSTTVKRLDQKIQDQRDSSPAPDMEISLADAPSPQPAD